MMTEKEREQELFNRMEKREALKTRMEIEQARNFEIFYMRVFINI